MPNGVYDPQDPIQRVTSGFDRPHELWQVLDRNGERVFIGYIDQCQRAIVDFKILGATIKKLHL